MPLQAVQNQAHKNPELGEKDVIVKFFFTNRGHIPAGIEEKVRLPDDVMDAANKARANASGHKHLGRTGRIREGRVDTGFPVVNNLPLTQPAMLRTGLANNGYGLADAHWFKKEVPGKTTKYVVVLSFRHGIEENLELGRKSIEAVRKLAKTVWFCHVWQNTTNFTVNFVGIQVDAKPKHSITTKDGQLAVVEVSDFTEEGDE